MSDPGTTHLCGHRILRELSPGRTWLAEDTAGRRIVLKLLDTDCLLGKELHPLIRDRLGRVRELAHLGVANLYGVERAEDARAYLAWEYVEGATWQEQQAPSPELCRELRNAVESLHALGIVHGALHERNIIIRPDGRVVLTHVSPLLYNDPQADWEALDKPAFHAAPDSSAAAPASAAPADSAEGAEDRRARRRALWGAILVILAGLLIAWLIWKWASRSSLEQTRNNNASPAVVSVGSTGKGNLCASDASHFWL